MDDRLEAAIADALARGRATWPALAVDPASFAAAIGHAVEGTPDPAAAVAELHAEDLYLAQACIGGGPAALDAFAATCDAALHGSLRSMGLAADLIEEVVQEVRARLFVAADGPPRIATYSGRAALRSWARTIATRAAVDRLRKHEDTTSDDAVLEALPDSGADPELAHFRRTYQAEFKQAFEEALATLDVRERNLLRHHFVDALTVEEIGAIYGVHKSTASRWLEAARAALSKRTRAGFQARVRALPGELDSILRLVQSQIDLSLSRVLG